MFSNNPLFCYSTKRNLVKFVFDNPNSAWSYFDISKTLFR